LIELGTSWKFSAERMKLMDEIVEAKRLLNQEDIPV
jgi:chorismate mutase